MRKTSILLLTSIFLLSGCAPVNMLTKLKKTPREYSENYPIEGIKAPKSEEHKKPWIVYSDRVDNAAFVNPGGKIKSAEVSFADPFLVIDTKGAYLELIKYKAENIKNNRLNERKKAEYVGWMHRSRLLLSPTSITDIRSGLKDKMITAITDSIAIMQSKRFFKEADSVQLSHAPNLSDTSGCIGLHEIVYRLKSSADGANSLISRTPDINTEKAKEQIVGWIPNVMLQNIGRQLFVRTWLPAGFQQPAILKYSPVLRAHNTDSTVVFNSGVCLPIIDKSNNKVYNIDGEAISYHQGIQIKSDLTHINVLFAIESATKLAEQYPILLNVIQNLRTLFVSAEYRFGAVVAVGNKLEKIDLTTDYTLLADSLTSFANQIAKSEKNVLKPWSALDGSVAMLENCGRETNLIIVIGDKGDTQNESAPSGIVQKLSTLNCRLLGIQLYASEENRYNNFVLQLSSMIDEYAAYRTKEKRRIILFADQTCRANTFRELNHNFYTLNYPLESMSQGGIVFPEKGELLQAEMLSPAIDSLLTQIRADNTLLSHRIDSAFLTVGNTKDKYDTTLMRKFGLPTAALNKDFKKLYDGKSPVWYNSRSKVTMPNSLIQYRLLLSDPELERLKTSLEALSAKEVDVKDLSKKRVKKSKDLCKYLELMEQLPDDQIQEVAATQDSVKMDTVYVSTRKVRRHLRNFYLSEVNQCRICRKSNKQLKRSMLSQAHEQIFGAPSNSPLLDHVSVGELKSKKKISDRELEQLILYFKARKEEIDQKCNDQKITSSANSYYYIDTELLP